MVARKPKGIFETLLAIHLVAILCVVALVGSFSCLKDYKESKRDLRQYGKLAAGTLRLAAVDPIVNRLAYDRIHDLVLNVDRDSPDIVNVVIYDVFGTFVAMSNESVEPAPLSKQELQKLYQLPRDSIGERPSDLADFEFMTVLSIGQDIIGFARVCVSTDRIDAALYDDITFFIGAALLALALSSLFYFYFISGRIVNPLTSIAANMEEFGRSKSVSSKNVFEDLHHIPVCEEIEKMHHSFQQMVTDVVSSNRAIREKEGQIRLLLNSTAEAIYGLDTDGKCTFCNAAFLHMLGYGSEEEMLGKNIHDLIHHTKPDGSPYPYEECKAHHAFLQGHQTHSEREVFFRSDGSSFPVEYWSHPIVTSGQVTGAVITFMDITAKQLAEKARRQSEGRLHAILENTTAVVYLKDMAGRYIIINRQFEEVLNIKEEKAIGKTDHELFPPDIAQTFATNDQMVAKKGIAIHFEEQAPHDDGIHFYVSTKFPLFDESNTVYAVGGVSTDISGIKQAEKNLAAEKERLAVTLRSIGDGVITTDTKGIVSMINKVAEDLTGWHYAEALNRPLLDVFDVIHEEDREQFEDPVKKVLASGMISGVASQTMLTTRDGMTRSIAHSSAPITDQDGEVVGVVIVFRDITDQLRTERELLKVRKLESVGVLAGGIAHDFNNILAAILGNINLALIDTSIGEKTKELLTEAEKASIRAKKLTQQLLTFAKGGEPIKELASLDNVIKDSANFVLHGDKVACQFHIPDDLWLVDIDKGQISQVVQNIVQNAAQAMPVGGVISISCENILPDNVPNLQELQHDKYVKIRIQDEGTGISEKVIERIFDPYFSTKEDGSGLGLAITHSIVKKHGGHIFVDSSSSGTSFTFYLPASEETETEPEQTQEQTKTSKNIKILVMDDEDIVRRVAKAMLLELGHEVEVSEEGSEAIKLYVEALKSDYKFDLVIMDLTIPGGMGGKEAMHALLQIDPSAMVVVSSGYCNDPIMANFKQYGFCAAIEKPYQMQEMSRLINELFV